jgi:mannose-6-phosphate isomerase-like protein (cupin superfamily)
MKRWIGIICLALLLCVGAVAQMARAQDQGGIKNIFEVLDKERMDPTQAFKSSPMLTGPGCSLNLGQLNKVVKSHYHKDHDEVVYVVRGNGLVTIAGKEYMVSPGWAYLVPRGTIHRFVNLGPDASIVLSTFSPAFDGKDRVFVEE